MEAFKNGQGNHQLNENEKPQLNSRSENLGDDTNSNRQSDRDEVMDRYSAEGFGQNVNGEYFNPYTDEYDASYEPHNDSS